MISTLTCGIYIHGSWKTLSSLGLSYQNLVTPGNYSFQIKKYLINRYVRSGFLSTSALPIDCIIFFCVNAAWSYDFISRLVRCLSFRVCKFEGPENKSHGLSMVSSTDNYGSIENATYEDFRKEQSMVEDILTRKTTYSEMLLFRTSWCYRIFAEYFLSQSTPKCGWIWLCVFYTNLKKVQSNYSWLTLIKTPAKYKYFQFKEVYYLRAAVIMFREYWSVFIRFMDGYRNCDQ